MATTTTTTVASSSTVRIASPAVSASSSPTVMEERPTEQSLAVVTTKNFISGIVGGGCEAFVGYPLETVKARMQTQDAKAFTGPFDCLQKSIKEGGVGSLYRGASPQIFRSAISASVLFGLMGQYRYFYNNYVFDNKPTYGLIAAGMSTGFTESILYTPFEIIKIRMQTQNSHNRTRVSNLHVVKEVYGQGGIRGLYRGFVPYAQREMLGNTAYFMAYEYAKGALLDKFVHSAPKMSPEKEHIRTYQAIALAGGYAGLMYWIVVFPVDTVKSVMQADRLVNPQYKGVVDCVQQLYKEGGPARFVRGISPSLIRSFPANAVTFVAFETCMSFLNKHF
uniref:Mitochondrial carrier protein n=1 Tax=Globisporangium ultimum (strain ATCC 200006 / CBS 805.95 / DAOM BR144) TaxID=431595 RepID=K3X0U1_GLOUD